MIKIGNISKGSGTAISQLTFQHIVTQQNNRMLVVAVHSNDGNDADPVVTGITFNGVALSVITTAHRGGAGVKSHTELWYLLAPSVGTFNVVITCTGTVDNLAGVAYELYNAMQQTPEGSGTNNLNGVSYISSAVSAISGDALYIDAVTANTAVTFTPDSGQTEQYDEAIAGSGRRAGSTENYTTFASRTQGQTASANTRLSYCVATLTGIHEIVVNDSVSLTEQPFANFDILDFSVLDPFHVLITEHTDILDMVVEVGVVMEAVSIHDFDGAIYVYLDELCVEVDDTCVITEQSIQYITLQNLSVYDDISTSDDIVISESIEITSVSDNVIISEYFNCVLVTLIIDIGAYDNINIVEDVQINLSNIEITVYEDITVTEYIVCLPDVRTIFIYDIINIAEDRTIVFDLFLINEADSISITEQIYFGENVRFVDVFDNVILIEAVNLFALFTTYLIFVNEDITLSDDLVITKYDTVLFNNVTEDVVVSEVAVFADGIYFIDVYEIIITDESLIASVPFLPIFATDNIILSEYQNAGKTILYIDVLDPFGVLITEHVDILDLVVEVGIVDTKIYLSDWVSLYLDVLVPFAPDMPFTLPQHEVKEWVELYIPLAISVNDTSTIAEYAEWLATILLNVFDVVGISEQVTMVRDPLFSVYDVISYTESAQGERDRYNIARFDSIVVSDSRLLYIDELYISISDMVATSDYANIHDIIIDLGVVVDTITVTENFLIQKIMAQPQFNVFDGISWMGDYVTIRLDRIIIVSDSIAIVESADITDLEIDMPEVSDDLLVSEYAETAYSEIDTPELFDDIIITDESSGAYSEYDISVSDNILIIEDIHIPEPSGDNDIIAGEDILVEEEGILSIALLYIEQSDDVIIDENISADVGNLFVGIYENLNIAEDFVASVFLPSMYINVYSAISVGETAYLITEGFTPRPPIIFDFHRYPTNSIVFEYDSRTITVPY